MTIGRMQVTLGEHGGPRMTPAAAAATATIAAAVATGAEEQANDDDDNGSGLDEGVEPAAKRRRTQTARLADELGSEKAKGKQPVSASLRF